MTAVGIVVFVVAGTVGGLSPSVIGGTGAGSIAAIYVFIRFWRQREIELNLATAASKVIVDEKRRRIAFLTPIDRKARWIVLEFKDNFSAASGGVRDIMSGKCLIGQITGVDMVLVVVVLTIIVLFAGVFGFLMLGGTMPVPATK